MPGGSETNYFVPAVFRTWYLPDVSPKLDRRGTARSWHCNGEPDVNYNEPDDFCGEMKKFGITASCKLHVPKGISVRIHATGSCGEEISCV